MSSANTFNLLLDDDNEDPNQLIAAQIKVAPAPKKVPASAQVAQPTKQGLLPTKPLPPAQAVRDARNGGPRGGAGGGRGGGRGFGRRGGFNNDNSFSNDNSLSSATYSDPAANRPSQEGDNVRRGGYGGGYGGPRGGARGGRRFDNGEVDGGDRPRRNYERRSGTGRGNEVKRDGSGRGNWGSPTEEVVQENGDAVNEAEKPAEQAQSEDVATKENPETEADVKEPEPEEDKEMTLEEYEKVLEEKRKALLALKAEERKVPVDKEFASMQLLSGKKTEAEIFVKLGSEKEKRKEVTEKEERTKKSVSINEFLKPAEGEVFYGRGRGRGGRGRGGAGGRGGGGLGVQLAVAPKIDETNFPSLGGK